MIKVRTLPTDLPSLTKLLVRHMVQGDVRVAVPTTVYRPLDVVLFTTADPALVSDAFEAAMQQVQG